MKEENLGTKKGRNEERKGNPLERIQGKERKEREGKERGNVARQMKAQRNREQEQSVSYLDILVEHVEPLFLGSFQIICEGNSFDS